MRPVNTQPRFKCDFCSRVTTESAMVRHEPICWKNPARFCPACDNTGEDVWDHGEGLIERHPCYYCSQRSPE